MTLFLAYLSPADWTGIIAIALTIIGGLGYLIYRTGGIVTIIERMEPQVAKIPGMEVKVEDMWAKKYTTNNSPIILNQEGQKVLELSKISEFTDKYYNEILEKVRATKPANPFQSQESLIKIVSEYQNNPDCKAKLEESSFSSGYGIESVLFVAAIHIRDRIIKDLGFNRDDLLSHKEPNL